MILGNRIKKLRKELDLTQQELGKRIGIKPNSISLIESGNRNASEQVILSICREFNVSENWLRTGEEPMFVPKEEDPLDELVKQRKLSDADRLLIEKFLGLKPKEREAVMGYLLEVADDYRRSTSTGQKKPTPVSEDGPEDSEKSLMDFVGDMNPGQQEEFYNQMHRLKGPQKESSTSASLPIVDGKVPESEPPDRS